MIVTGAFSRNWSWGKGVAPDLCDPYYANVSLLLHMDGVNGSTTFTDNSVNSYTPTLLGTTTPSTSTTQKKFGTASGWFQSSGTAGLQYSIASPLDIYTGNGSFTIEMWIYPTSVGNYGLIGSWRQSGSEDLYLITIESGVIKLYWGNFSPSSPLLSGGSILINTWTHIAVVRNVNDFAVYINGTSVSTATFSVPSTKNWWYTQIGLYANNNFPYNGYIDDVRITKGVARYTGNFTPPAAAFPNTGCTDLVLVNPAIIPETLFAIQTYSSNIPNTVIVPETLSGIETYSSNIPNTVIVPEILSGIETYSSNVPNPISIPLTLGS